MISLLCKRAQSLLARVLREESGSAAVNVVFFLIGGIALTAFVVDATRVSADGARLKQATDAAAQAVEGLRDGCAGDGSALCCRQSGFG